MPEIDVSDVTRDSLVAGTAFQVVRRRSRTIRGFQQSTDVTVNAIGSVTPVGDNSLVREETFQSQNKSLMIVTTFLLRAATSNLGGWQWQPDLVLWQGTHFLVRTVKDYSQFGIGMVEADCVSFDYVGRGPGENPPAYGWLNFSLSNQSGLGGTFGGTH